jgi:hypothetical protein
VNREENDDGLIKDIIWEFTGCKVNKGKAIPATGRGGP